jgi:outer membrane receptor for ferric coprogen and ferric-rhodotorulic acid
VNHFKTLLVVLTLASPWAYAQTDSYQTTRGGAIPDTYSTGQQTGFAGYLGLNAGYTGHNNDIDVEGAPSSVKLLGSYVIPSGRGVFDAGYGLQAQKFSSDTARDSSISTGVMELAARYQFENRWQLGAIYNQFFDKGANFGANQADAEFAGAQLLREFTMGTNFLGRAGLRAMTSVNVNGNNVNMAMIDFQMGWGQTGRTVSTSSAAPVENSTN